MNLHTYVNGTIQARSYRLLRQQVAGVLDVYNLNTTYWAMLGIIYEAKDGIRQTDVAEALQVKPPMVTVMARELVKQGYIISVTNQFDARAKLLKTSAIGNKFVKQVETHMSKMLDTVLQGLTEADMAVYHKVLKTIIANSSQALA